MTHTFGSVATLASRFDGSIARVHIGQVAEFSMQRALSFARVTLPSLPMLTSDESIDSGHDAGEHDTGAADGDGKMMTLERYFEDLALDGPLEAREYAAGQATSPDLADAAEDEWLSEACDVLGPMPVGVNKSWTTFRSTGWR